MATIVAKGGGGLLGGLGKVAGIAGMATGTPWLSMLGLGMGAMNGNSSAQEEIDGVLGQMLKNGWQNPAEGNIASPYEATAKDWAGMINPRLIGMGARW